MVRPDQPRRWTEAGAAGGADAGGGEGMKAVLGLVLLLTCGAAAQKAEFADAIFVNGKVFRGTNTTTIDISPFASRDELFKKLRGVVNPTAIAVREGRVVAVGTDDEIRKLKGKRTQVVDL